MKRYIKLDEENRIVDIFNEANNNRFDGSEIEYDVTDSYADVWINGKGIFNGKGEPIYKYEKGVATELDQTEYLEWLKEEKTKECLLKRKNAYVEESDGLFFDYQRGNVERSVWEDKVLEIKSRYPKP